jgi:hypothetical protein
MSIHSLLDAIAAEGGRHEKAPVCSGRRIPKLFRHILPAHAFSPEQLKDLNLMKICRTSVLGGAPGKMRPVFV